MLISYLAEYAHCEPNVRNSYSALYMITHTSYKIQYFYNFFKFFLKKIFPCPQSKKYNIHCLFVFVLYKL